MPPPVSYIDITSLPFSQVVTAADFNAGTYGGVTNTTWLRYIAGATQVFSFTTTDPFTNAFQRPVITFFASDGTTVLKNWSNPVAGGYGVTSGNTYYIRIIRNLSGGPADQNFTVGADVLDYITSVPANALIINDDTAGFSALAFTLAGEFLGFIQNIPPGEMADALPNGISIWHDRFASSNKIKLIARDLTTIAQFDIPTLGAFFPSFTHGDTNFYASDGHNPSIIYKITQAGVVSEIAHLTGTNDVGYVIAVNADETILYYTTGGSDITIHRWDLVNDITLTDLYTISALIGVPSYRVAQTPNNHPGDILRLNDGSIVIYYNNITSSQAVLLHIAASGTLLHSYNMTSSNYQIDHLAYSLNNPNSIIIWLYSNLDNSTAIIGEYTLATGNFSNSFSTELFQQLTNLNFDGSGQQLFGPSNSCTIVQIFDAAPAGTASLTINKITVPSPDPTNTNFDFTTTGGLSPTTFSLQNGDSQVYSNLSPGTYGVSEIVPQGWAVIYSVSNGDPHDAIEIEDGDNIIVTVTNTRTELENALSGIYKIEPGKRQETLWQSFLPERTKMVKIPNPNAKTGLLGG